MPARELRCLVGVASEVQPEAGLGRVPAKFEIGRAIVARVYADHDELIDAARIEIARQIGQCRRQPSARRLVGFDEINGRLQLRVDPVDQRVEFRAKRPAGQHRGAAAVGGQVGGGLFGQAQCGVG